MNNFIKQNQFRIVLIAVMVALGGFALYQFDMAFETIKNFIVK